MDTAAVTLTTASGKICQISNSCRATSGYDQRGDVRGSGGVIRAANVVENTHDVATGNGLRAQILAGATAQSLQTGLPVAV